MQRASMNDTRGFSLSTDIELTPSSSRSKAAILGGSVTVRPGSKNGLNRRFEIMFG